MEACVDLYRGPRTIPRQSTVVVVFSLGFGGVTEGGPVAGQLSGTPCAGLTHLTLRVPVLGSRGLSPSRSPALQLGPQGSLW